MSKDKRQDDAACIPGTQLLSTSLLARVLLWQK